MNEIGKPTQRIQNSGHLWSYYPFLDPNFPISPAPKKKEKKEGKREDYKTLLNPALFSSNC